MIRNDAVKFKYNFIEGIQGLFSPAQLRKRRGDIVIGFSLFCSSVLLSTPDRRYLATPPIASTSHSETQQASSSWSVDVHVTFGLSFYNCAGFFFMGCKCVFDFWVRVR